MESTKKKSAPSPVVRWTKALGSYLGGAGRWLAGIGILVAAFAGGVWLGWQVVREKVLFSETYLVQREHLILTPPPPDWIACDVLGEVFRTATRDGPLYLWQENLSEHLAEALRQHPWVAKVESVRKTYPTQIEAKIQWRRPVCMVLWQQRSWPVDAEGILLPQVLLAPTDQQKYPNLVGLFAPPPHIPGARWQDAQVLEGAQIAAALLPVWEKFHLAAIQAVLLPAGATAQTIYELATYRGSRIIWGLGPSSQHPAEPTVADKIARLERYVQQYGSLDALPDGQAIDLRLLPAVPANGPP